MRQRKIKNLDEKLKNYESFMISEEAFEGNFKGCWRALFNEPNSPGSEAGDKLFLEIGCGKGRFIRQLAKEQPDNCFIAIEGQQSVVLRAMEGCEDENIENVRFLTSYISDVTDIFQPGELDGIYLNFSDPWPKARHAKRRLTYGMKLLQYAKAVGIEGFIQFKTDNDDLFQFTIEEIERVGLEIITMTCDLHNSKLMQGNIMTEYEEKFSSCGKNINYVKIRGI